MIELSNHIVNKKTKESPGQKSQPRATTQSVVSQIRKSINDGIYKHSDRLPAERQLAEKLNASRGTIRSALFQLEKQNLVRRDTGSGTYVTANDEFSADEIVRITGPLEVIEVRIAIEPHMMKLAVANASPNDLDRLALALKQLTNCNDDPDLFTVADTNFHIALAECARNSLMIWLYKQISRVREHSQWRRAKEKVITPEKIQKYNREHNTLYEAIASGHADEAFQIMNSHLHGARNDLLGQ